MAKKYDRSRAALIWGHAIYFQIGSVNWEVRVHGMGTQIRMKSPATKRWVDVNIEDVGKWIESKKGR